jgi:hypothetical protein
MKRILIFVPLIFLSACASKKPVVVKMPPAVSGSALTTADMESVRYGENMKAYPVGRYVDPNNGLVMHEAHTIYRVETTAKWNLHLDVYPYAPGNLPGGPVVGIIDPAHQNSPMTPEIVAEVDRQKAATQALMAQSQRMNQALNQLAKILPVTSQVAEENAQLKAQTLATARRLEILEDQMRKQPSQQPAELDTKSDFTPPVAPSVKGTNDW